MNVGGFVLPAATVGLGFVSIKPQRGFYPGNGGPNGPLPNLIAQAVERETHHDELEITDHPVEQGALISDHAFKKPAEVIIRCAWSNSPSGPGTLIGAAVGAAATFFPAVGTLAALPGTLTAAQSILQGQGPQQVTSIYAKLLELQAARVPFDIYTGKRKYTNMLFKSITVETDLEKENSLWVVAHCRQVIIVTTKVVAVPINIAAQAAPEITSPIQDEGVQQLLDDVPASFIDSAVSSGFEGLASKFPFSSAAPEAFKIALDGVTQGISNVWNAVSGSWSTSISDAVGNKVLGNLPMVTGCNLLEQFDYLKVGGGLFAQTTHAADAVPTFENLGKNGNLYFKSLLPTP